MQIQNISPVLLHSGQYEIGDICNVHPFENPGKMKVQCDMETDKGGWIVIQRRVPNGTVNFYQGWKDYEEGFGNLDSEFWYGLRNIHCLTTRESVELRIDLQDEQGNKVTWVYQQFSVDGPDQKYRLHIGQGIGTPGSFDAMAHHNNMYFSTFDHDNDQWGGNCAVTYKGAWWYRSCFNANLNGPHDPITPPPPVATANRIMWFNGTHLIYYPSVEMKVRPKICVLPTTTQCK